MLDRISDYACDWWLDTCVAMSKIFVLFYTSVIGILGYNFYFLVKERGKTAAGLAGIELGKQMMVVAQTRVDDVAYYAAHQQEFKDDVKKYYQKTQELIQNLAASANSAGGSGGGNSDSNVEMKSFKKNEGGSPSAKRQKKVD